MMVFGICVWLAFSVLVCVGNARWAKQMEAYDKAVGDVK
jgi:hypothetical protein